MTPQPPTSCRAPHVARGELWFRRAGASLSAALAFASLAVLLALVLDAQREPRSAYDIASLLVASFRLSLCALAIAVPFALGAALFCESVCPRALRPSARGVLHSLGALPPLLWGLASGWVLLPALDAWRGTPLPVSQRAVCTVALVITSALARALLAHLRALPVGLTQAALALGGSTLSLYGRVLLPAAAPMICRSLAVALVRALGEGVALHLVLHAASSPLALAPHLVHSTLTNTPPARPQGTHDLAGFATASLMLVGVTLSLVLLVHAATTRWLELRAQRAEQA